MEEASIPRRRGKKKERAVHSCGCQEEDIDDDIVVEGNNNA